MRTDTPDLPAARHAATAGDFDALVAHRVPTLRALLAELSGEDNRSPNKRYLARRILEAVADLNNAGLAPDASTEPGAKPTLRLLPGGLDDTPPCAPPVLDATDADDAEPIATIGSEPDAAAAQPDAPSANQGADSAEAAPSLADQPAAPHAANSAPTSEAAAESQPARRTRRNRRVIRAADAAPTSDARASEAEPAADNEGADSADTAPSLADEPAAPHAANSAPTVEAAAEPQPAPRSRRNRRVIRAADAAPAEAPASAEIAPASEAEPAAPTTEPSADTEEDDNTRARRYLAGELKPRHVNVAQLRIAYRLAVGRDTGSDHKGYLIWKIREAQKGRIPTGPVERSAAPAEDHQVLPLRLPTSRVTALDEAVARLGYTSRMAFLRDAIGRTLAAKGEQTAAALFLLG